MSLEELETESERGTYYVPTFVNTELRAFPEDSLIGYYQGVDSEDTSREATLNDMFYLKEYQKEFLDYNNLVLTENTNSVYAKIVTSGFQLQSYLVAYAYKLSDPTQTDIYVLMTCNRSGTSFTPAVLGLDVPKSNIQKDSKVTWFDYTRGPMVGKRQGELKFRRHGDIRIDKKMEVIEQLTRLMGGRMFVGLNPFEKLTKARSWKTMS
jgi:hypothetical protein